MKKALIPVLAVMAASIALPVSAQHYGPPRGGPAWSAPHHGAPMAVRTRELQRNVDFAYRARVMSTGKAREFQRDIQNLIRLEQDYRYRGMSHGQRNDLERRYQRLDSAIMRYVARAQYRR